MELQKACNQLVAEVTTRCTRIARDVNWPTEDVDVWFGANALPLRMTVLTGSAATRMRDLELAARLRAAAKHGLDEPEMTELCARLGYTMMLGQVIGAPYTYTRAAAPMTA